MSARPHVAPCAACNQALPGSKLSRVVIDGTAVLLCRAHAATVAAHMPRTYEDLRALFLEPASAEHPSRRSVLERRRDDDRRVFPPRPEGRRMGGGRRATDTAA